MRNLRKSFLLPLLSLPILVVGYLALPIMTSPASASGTTLYVAIGGHDTGNCQAAPSPCATIDYAASQASFITANVGDTISVGPGVFKANLESTPEEAGHGLYGPLTIKGHSSHHGMGTTIEPGNLSLSILGGSGVYVLNDLTIDGLGDTVANVSGIFNIQDSSVTITDSTITNSASVFSDCCNGAAFAVITDSTLTGNARILDLSGPWDTVSITASTITNNGSGIENSSEHAGTTQCGDGITCVTVTSSLLSDNHGKDCVGELIDGGYNLADDTSCGSTNYSPTLDGYLGTLGPNGGPTDTIPLLAGSPAIGLVHSAALCSTPDQRGVHRPAPNCDSGAYQTAPPSITSPASATFVHGAFSSFTVRATGTPALALSETGPLPIGITFKDNGNDTATLSGTSIIGGVGNHPITITASNGVLPDAVQNFTLKVYPATPVIIWAPPSPITYGTLLSPTQLDATATVTGGGHSPTPRLLGRRFKPEVTHCQSPSFRTTQPITQMPLPALRSR